MLKARASIWRIRSLVTPNSAPTCFQRQRFLSALQAEAADDDLLLALVKPVEDLARPATSRCDLRRFLLELIAPVVLRRR